MVTVSSGSRRAVLAAAVVVLALVLAVTLSTKRTHDADAADRARTDGPMKVAAGDTDLVFTAPPGDADWTVTAGSFLLCAPDPQIVLRDVSAIDQTDVGGFRAVVREFRIRPRKAPFVAEPIIGAYGTPPRVGGVTSPWESRLVGTITAADDADLMVPTCERSTSAPGERAVELMLSVTGGRRGASVDGVRVRYEADGIEYQTKIAVTLILCGTTVTDTDC